MKKYRKYQTGNRAQGEKIKENRKKGRENTPESSEMDENIKIKIKIWIKMDEKANKMDEKEKPSFQFPGCREHWKEGGKHYRRMRRPCSVIRDPFRPVCFTASPFCSRSFRRPRRRYSLMEVSRRSERA